LRLSRCPSAWGAARRRPFATAASSTNSCPRCPGKRETASYRGYGCRRRDSNPTRGL
jgi:hypothetical protein